MASPPAIYASSKATVNELAYQHATQGVLTGICGTSSKKRFQPGDSVAKILRVRLSTREGRFWPGITIQFEVASGGGTVTHAMQITDALGAAALPRNAWTLGPQSGIQTLTATALTTGIEGNPHLFRRVVVEEQVASIIHIISGDHQSGPVNTTLPEPLLVEILATDGITPVPDANVTWSIVGATGTTLLLTSDNQGLSSIIIQTGGYAAKQYLVTASLDNGSMVSFTFTVTP